MVLDLGGYGIFELGRDTLCGEDVAEEDFFDIGRLDACSFDSSFEKVSFEVFFFFFW